MMPRSPGASLLLPQGCSSLDIPILQILVNQVRDKDYSNTPPMCIYVLSVPLCGHSPALLFGPSCPAVFAQLDRINEPAAWEPPGLYELPFHLPDACLPNERNIAVMRSADFCGLCQVEYGYGYAYAEGSAQGNGHGYECEDQSGGCPLGRWPGVDMYWEPRRVGVGWRT